MLSVAMAALLEYGDYPAPSDFFPLNVSSSQNSLPITATHTFFRIFRTPLRSFFNPDGDIGL